MADIYKTEDGQTFSDRGTAQSHANNLAENAAYISQLREKHAPERDKQDRVLNLFRSGKYSEFIAIIEKDESLRVPFWASMIGRSYLYLNNYERAIYWLEYCHETADARRHTHSSHCDYLEALLAVAYMKQGNNAKAMEMCRIAVRKFLNLDRKFRHIQDYFIEPIETLRENGLITDQDLQRDIKKIIKYQTGKGGSAYSAGPRGVFLSIVFGLIGGIGFVWTLGWIFELFPVSNLQSWIFLIPFAVGAVLTFITWRNKSKFFFPLIILALFGWLYYFHIVPKPNGKPATTQTQTQTATTSQNVNFRDKPSTDSNIIRQIPQGETITITGEAQNGWTPIKHGKDKGWISSEFIKQ